MIWLLEKIFFLATIFLSFLIIKKLDKTSALRREGWRSEKGGAFILLTDGAYSRLLRNVLSDLYKYSTPEKLIADVESVFEDKAAEDNSTILVIEI